MEDDDRPTTKMRPVETAVHDKRRGQAPLDEDVLRDIERRQFRASEPRG